MSIDIQVFEKGPLKVVLGWSKTATPNIKSYNLYVSTIEGTAGYSLIKAKIPNAEASDGITKGHVGIQVTEAEIIALGGVFAATTIETTNYYFRVTEIDMSDVESALASATSRAIGTLGTRTKQEFDDERKNAHTYGYSEGLQSWRRNASTSQGAMAVSTLGYYEDNITIDRTFDGSGNTLTELVYLTGAQSGDRAKLYTYSAPFSVLGTPTSTVVSDSVVP